VEVFGEYGGDVGAGGGEPEPAQDRVEGLGFGSGKGGDHGEDGGTVRGGVQGDRGGQVGDGAGGDQTLGGRGEPAQPGSQAQIRSWGGRGAGQGGQDGGGLFGVQVLGDGQDQFGGVVVAGGVFEGGQQMGVSQSVWYRWVPQFSCRVGVDPPELGRQLRARARVEAGQGRGTVQDRGAGSQVAGRDQERRGDGVGSLRFGQGEARAGQGRSHEPCLVIQDPAQRVPGVPAARGLIGAGCGGGSLVQYREQGCGVQVQGRRGRCGGRWW
jgi:hypothetical protein